MLELLMLYFMVTLLQNHIRCSAVKFWTSDTIIIDFIQIKDNDKVRSYYIVFFTSTGYSSNKILIADKDVAEL